MGRSLFLQSVVRSRWGQLPCGRPQQSLTHVKAATLRPAPRMSFATTRQMESPVKQIDGFAASKQARTTPQMVCGSVLTWSIGAARVRHANATIDRSLHQFKLQHASDRGGHHSAVLLLRRGRGDHAAAFDFAGLLSGSGSGIPGENGFAPNAGSNGHGADPDRRAGRGWLRAMDADRGFRRELAEIRQCSTAGCWRRGRQNQGDRGAGFADCAGARLVIRGIGSLYALFLEITFMPFLVFFMLAEKREVWHGTLQLFPSSRRTQVKETLEDLRDVLRDYLAGMSIVTLAVIAVSSLFFWMMGLDYPILTGIVSGLLNMVPYMGAVLALLPPFLISLPQLRTLSQFFLFSLS